MIVATQVLNKLLQTKNYNFVKSNCLDASYFKGYEKEFDFIEEHYKKYGIIPDTLTFLSKFQDFDVTEVNETDEYLLDKLYEERCFHQFEPLLKKLEELNLEDSRLAYNYLMSNLASLKPHNVCNGIDIIANARERYDQYATRSYAPETSKISTGMVELDEIFNGWEFGDELVTVVARTNAGKSWLLLKFLSEAWKQGYKVGLYSGEMNHIKLGYRFDALFQHFSNKKLSWGAPIEEDYNKYTLDLSKNPNPFIIITQKQFGGRPTVQKIRNFIEENNIEIMGIDQYSLMDDGRALSRDPTRLRMAHISEDLFLLSSEYKIPILGLAQANRASVQKENELDAPGLENIKECDDIAHNSSKCIGMKQSSQGLILDIIKNREGKVGNKLIYSWDIDTGHFSYIPTTGDAASSTIRQQAIQQTKEQFAGGVNPF